VGFFWIVVIIVWIYSYIYHCVSDYYIFYVIFFFLLFAFIETYFWIDSDWVFPILKPHLVFGIRT